MTQRSQYFYCNGFQLECYKPAYLVKVQKVEGENNCGTSISDLPEWIFSRNAIWLSGFETSMFIRSTYGDEIKNKFADLCRAKTGSIRRHAGA